jgi:phenylalanyl-tRNA synthetase beta chain
MDTPADIVEEILRIDGLDAVAIPTRSSYTPSVPRLSDRSLREKVAHLLCGNGFSEILTNSIVNSRQYADVSTLVTLRNSLSQELDCMRPRLLESGLAVMSHNLARRQENLLFFEIGKVYHSTGAPGAYNEESRLALWSTGHSNPSGWNTASQAADLYFLKGAIQALATRCGISGLSESESTDGVIWTLRNTELGRAFYVPNQVLTTFGIEVPVYAAELNWDAWVKAARLSTITAKELPKAPEVQRDLALVLDAGSRYAQVEAITAGLKILALQSAKLFDVFQGEKLGANRKSYAIRYTFSGGDKTLTDAEVEGWMQQLIEAYRKTLNAEIRSA